jgi:hypothetical protein
MHMRRNATYIRGLLCFFHIQVLLCNTPDEVENICNRAINKK